MAVSQNGWAVDSLGDNQDRGSIIPGVLVPNGIRKGDVATVLRYVAHRFHTEVEPLKAGACWGWYVKRIEGTLSTSNHASGTAIDLNASDHPMGSIGTFSAGKVAAIRRILHDCDGVVRWGGDYHSRKDEMHWEIVGTPAEVHALAAKITTPTGRKLVMESLAGYSLPVLVQGDDDAELGGYDRISRAQAVLAWLGHYTGKIDGSYGPMTVAAVKSLNVNDGKSITAQVWAKILGLSKTG